MPYRTYDSAWNRTGYSDTPQYSGQQPQTADYQCHCGAAMARWSVGWGAFCGNGHEMVKEPA
jgi:hypothetical protein